MPLILCTLWSIQCTNKPTAISATAAAAKPGLSATSSSCGRDDVPTYINIIAPLNDAGSNVILDDAGHSRELKKLKRRRRGRGGARGRRRGIAAEPNDSEASD